MFVIRAIYFQRTYVPSVFIETLSPPTDLFKYTFSPLLCHHRLVLETLEPLPADRKCFRMINGVLVERTVKDVIPALKTNSEGLRKVLEDLVKQYNSKQVEMEKWKVMLLEQRRESDQLT
jgi:chaperonin cofactor prefoldin